MSEVWPTGGMRDPDGIYGVGLDDHGHADTIPARGAWWRGVKARWRDCPKRLNPYRWDTANGKHLHKFEWLWNEGWECCDGYLKKIEARTKTRKTRKTRNSRLANIS